MNLANHLSTKWKPVLRRAATSGKKAILRNYDLTNRTTVVKRGVGGDLTLKIDELSERAIYSSLRKDLGKESFVFLSEELGEIGARDHSAPVVICDPLDGSHNAQSGIPFFSIALSVIESPRDEQDRTFGNLTSGIILSIKTEDEYFATKGEGAYHNNKRLSPRRNGASQIQTLLIETGDFDYLKGRLLPKFSKRYVNKTRMLGSAALSYCLLADGSADAMIFAQPGGARTIDSPAGYLIARENGCVFSDASGRFSNIDQVKVGFDSRINLVGAHNKETCERLKKLVSAP